MQVAKNSMDSDKHQQIIPEEMAGLRLDQTLARLFPDYSRSRLQQWVKAGRITVDGILKRSKDRVKGGETLVLDAEAEKTENQYSAEDIRLDIIYEDEALFILNKPAGLVVHPAPGNWSGTLLNGLLYRYPELNEIPRAGIVHRLDKLTSGLMVVARTLQSHYDLVKQLQERTIGRQYLALVQGTMVAGGTIDKPIARHPGDRKKMAIIPAGKEAITHYRIEQRFKDFVLLRVKLETGRTHQIRVHMASITHPIVGDPVYRGRLAVPAKSEAPLVEGLRGFRRQALHAQKLVLQHPVTAEELSFSAPPPEDFKTLIQLLEKYSPP